MIEQQLLVDKEQSISPLKQILDAPPTANPTNKTTTKSIKESLDTLFPEQQYQEKRVQKAKEILGTLAQEFTEAQLRDTITEIQFLADTWLDDFERKTFDGVTLQELLHEKGGL